MPATPRDPSPTATAAPVVLDVETRMMENYRRAAPVHVGRDDVTAIRNGRGDVELFFIRDDGTLWNLHPDPASETGWRTVWTGLYGWAFTAARDADGLLIVWGVRELHLDFVKERDEPGARWSVPTRIEYERPPNAWRVVKLSAERVGTRTFVAMVVESQAEPRYTLYVSAGEWVPGSRLWAAGAVPTLDLVWMTDHPDGVAYVCIDRLELVICFVEQRRLTRQRVFGHEIYAVTSARDRAGTTQVFASLFGRPHRLVTEGEWRWSPVATSDDAIFRQLVAAPGLDGDVHLLGVTLTDDLHHWSPVLLNDAAAPPVIARDVRAIAAVGEDEGELELFAVNADHGSLTHLAYEDVSTNWAREHVSTPDGGTIEAYASYTSDIMAFDAAGAPLAGSPVEITAAEAAKITVNGSVFQLDPHRPARTATNVVGQLSISQETGSLAIPALGLRFLDHMPDRETIALDQAAEVEHHLAIVSPAELLAATDADGEPILPAPYRTETSTEALAEILHGCMAITASRTNGAVALPGIERSNRGVAFLADTPLAEVRALGAADQSWRAVFSDDGISFEDLSAADAAARIAAARGNFSLWPGDLGDLIAGIVSKVVTVVEVTVATVAKGVEAAITFVSGAAEWVLHTVVDAAEQALDLAEAALAVVKVPFEQFYKWASYAFSWPDVLRTQDALGHAVREFLKFLEGAVDGTKLVVGQALTDLEGRIDEVFEQAIGSLTPGTTIGGLERRGRELAGPRVTGLTSATANNVVFNNLVQNARNATAPARKGMPDVEELIRRLREFAESIHGTDDLKRAVAYFSDAMSSPERFASQALSGLLSIAKGIVRMLVSGVKAVTDLMLDMLSSVLAWARTLLDEPWEIPFVSDLYRSMTGRRDLTMLDLALLVDAIPVTIYCKTAYGRAPFPDDASVTRFQRSFDAHTLLVAAGFAPALASAPPPAVANDPYPPPVSRDGLIALAVSTGVATHYYGQFSALGDALANADPGEIGEAIGWATLGAEIVGTACSCPWLYGDSPVTCLTPEGRGTVLWCIGGLGVPLDAAFMLVGGGIPETSSDAGVLVALGFATFHVLATVVCTAGEDDPLAIADNWVPVVPELCKLGLLSEIVAGSDGTSPLVVAGIDILFYSGSAIISTSAALRDITAEPA